MAGQLRILEQTGSGAPLRDLSFERLTERLSVRELLRAYVYEGVREANVRDALTPATRADRSIGERIDWEAQFESVLDAFTEGGIIVIVEGVHLRSLDDEIDLALDSPVTLLRLVPLEGR